MKNRRDFLVRSVGATAALAAAGLVQTACTPPPEPVARGYRVGQRLPSIVGPNQYGGTSSTDDLRGSWVLIDLCPWWCLPCTGSAAHHRAFLRSARAAGVDLRILPVVIDTFGSQPSGRIHAEQWTAYFGLDSEFALHCDDDAQSPLRRLVDDFAVANGAAPAYPTYVLVDPQGVIRHYQASSELETVQAKLAELTGTSLTGTWPPETVIGPPQKIENPALVTAKGRLANGVEFDESFMFGSSGQHVNVEYSRFAVPVLAPFGGHIHNLSMPFDPAAPLTATIRAASPSHGVRYMRVTGFTAPVAIVPDDAFLSEGAIDESKVVITEGSITNVGDSSTLTIPPMEPLLGPGRYSRMVGVNLIGASMRFAMPFTLAESMLSDMTTTEIDPASAAITTSLQSVTSQLGALNFAGASGAARQVVTHARAAGNDLSLIADADFLVELLDHAAAGI